MAEFPVPDLQEYKARTLSYKSTQHGDIKVDVAYPNDVSSSTRTVLLHYHGGFLVVGDRYAFFPYWLFNACVSRGWIFVTPDYRLMPESTAQSSLSDAIDAYEWVLSTLPDELGCKLGPVLMAGSSAGGYLALATAAAVQRPPSALLLIYGMLDATDSRYTTPGTNIFGRPNIETDATLKAYPMAKSGDTREEVSAYRLPENPAADSRFGLIAALHIDALFLDYMTGIEGLGRLVAANGVTAIPDSHRNLFPLSFGDLTNLPKTLLLHGKIDSAVPVNLSINAAEKLQAAGVEVRADFPDDAEHGFDARSGNVNIEAKEGEKVADYQSLRDAIKFLDSAASAAV